MEKHNKKRASLRQYPVLLAFGLFFLGLFVLDQMCIRDSDCFLIDEQNLCSGKPAQGFLFYGSSILVVRCV